jgi:hypothetical protein|tara:strand:+ start:1047 stop:1535 length:489 start_codon:yes stop_codon:yes gene_type:complete
MPQQNNPQYLADMSFGFGEEDIIQPLLEEHFGKLNKLDKYNPFDFENDDYIIEVKSRRINHDKYNSLMFNYSKIEKLEGYEDKKPAIFVFNCEDGIYYWEYDSSQFTIGRGGRCDRGCNEYSRMAYVSTEYLKCIEDMPTFNGFDDEEKDSCCKKFLSKKEE